MTSLQLAASISLALIAQLALAVGLAVRRYRRLLDERVAQGGDDAGATQIATQAGAAGGADLLRRNVLPFGLLFLALVLTTLAIDAVLHFHDIVWVGRYLGIPGVLLILYSLRYSLRKHKIITSGHPMTLLRQHEWLAWLGALLVLVHAGIHFNALLPWLAIGAMLINVGSGLTGKFLMTRARRRLEGKRQQLKREGLSASVIEERLYDDSLTFEFVKQWRSVHVPITLAFAVLALTHIIGICLFWGWR